LVAVGQYPQKRAILSAEPSYSQALSAVVKSIRLRNIEEGAYWLKYCWGFRDKLTGSLFRTVRRLLIGAAEDGHSIAIMERLAENFDVLLFPDVELSRIIEELVCICKVRNWWHPDTGGHDYIRSGMLAHRRTLYNQQTYSLDECLASIVKSIEKQDKVSALFWMMKAEESGKGTGLALAHRFYDIAVSQSHSQAMRLMRNIYLRHSSVLSDDNNFIAQAAWLLAGGNSPVIEEIETVTQQEVQEILEKVNATPPYVIPEWCCDGIHCEGNDTRYMGMWDRMFAVCRQFNHYQRVTPDDPWLEDQFYSLDGLHIGAPQ